MLVVHKPSTVVSETDMVVSETDMVVSETDPVVSETDPVVSETDPVVSETEEKKCRICLEPNLHGCSPVCSPCHCVGSQLYVHNHCLDEWRSRFPKNHVNRERCNQCRRDYRVHLDSMLDLPPLREQSIQYFHDTRFRENRQTLMDRFFIYHFIYAFVSLLLTIIIFVATPATSPTPLYLRFNMFTPLQYTQFAFTFSNACVYLLFTMDFISLPSVMLTSFLLMNDRSGMYSILLSTLYLLGIGYRIVLMYRNIPPIDNHPLQRLLL